MTDRSSAGGYGARPGRFASPGTSGSLDGRRYLILGGAGGIGSALARRLAARGAQLTLAGRSPEPLEELAAELDAHAVTLQARDFDEVDGAVEEIAGEGALDGAANCVGSILLKPAHLTSAADLEETLGQNLVSAFALVRAMGRHATRQDDGAAVALVSTTAARVGLANHEAVAAAKAGVEGLVRSAAATYASAGLRVNAVAPGLVDTPLAKRITGNEKALKASQKMHPLGRIGEPDEIARVLEWLLAPEGSWVTGQVMPVDGGLSTVRQG
jgi:NAD(P)-dependent dehydrogenase (short-subunit alcohol dehydrogenase family)